MEIQPRNQFNEGQALISMLERTDKNSQTLYIGDRNYFSWNTVAHINAANQFYLFRLKDLYYKGSSFKNIVPECNTEFDVYKELKLTRSTKGIYKSNPDKYKCIINKHVFDYIEVGDFTSFYPLAFRIISIEISKDKYEYILTNLPTDKFPTAIIKQLYKMRWNEEVSFKLLKYACALSWFHSVKRENIYQEIYARLIMYNFTSLIIKSTEDDISKSYKHISKPSFSNASKVTRMLLINKISNELIKTLILSEIIPIRDGRHAPRNVKTQRLYPLNTRV